MHGLEYDKQNVEDEVRSKHYRDQYPRDEKVGRKEDDYKKEEREKEKEDIYQHN